MKIEARFHESTFTLTYLVWDEASKDAVIIDPVLDYEQVGSKTHTTAARALAERVRGLGLRVHFVLETHAHADHISGAQFLKRELDAKVGIGEHITEVQATFGPIFGLGDGFAADGSQFDLLVKDNQVLTAGALEINVLHTPGHTPACVTYRIGDALFTGDALFMPDYGTGRCDFPKGSAENLYDSVHEKLYSLPDETRVFVGHDYQPGGRELRYETTIGESKRSNVRLKGDTSREDFVRFRKERDGSLSAPRLLFPSVQINIQAGLLPAPSSGGVRLLNIPINLFKPSDETGDVDGGA